MIPSSSIFFKDKGDLDRFIQFKAPQVISSSVIEDKLDYVWNDMVNLLPTWMAPNLITLLAFLVNQIGLFVLWSVPAHEPLGSVQLAIIIFCLTAYQSLDVLDGKQARRTGNCSPIGHFLDHGLDAISVLPLVENILKGLTITDPRLSLGILVFFYYMFFLETGFEKINGKVCTNVGGYGVVELHMLVIGFEMVQLIFGRWILDFPFLFGYSMTDILFITGLQCLLPLLFIAGPLMLYREASIRGKLGLYLPDTLNFLILTLGFFLIPEDLISRNLIQAKLVVACQAGNLLQRMLFSGILRDELPLSSTVSLFLASFACLIRLINPAFPGTADYLFGILTLISLTLAFCWFAGLLLELKQKLGIRIFTVPYTKE